MPALPGGATGTDGSYLLNELIRVQMYVPKCLAHKLIHFGCPMTQRKRRRVRNCRLFDYCNWCSDRICHWASVYQEMTSKHREVVFANSTFHCTVWTETSLAAARIAGTFVLFFGVGLLGAFIIWLIQS